MEYPRRSPEAPVAPQEREGAERTPEAAEAAAEAAEAEEAAKEFESEEAAFVSAGDAEFARVTAVPDVPKEELDADPDLQAAKREIDEIAAQGRNTTGAFKMRLAGIGARMKRFGRAIVAGAVLSGSAMNVAEAAPPPDRGPKLEHVEKGTSAPAWKDVLAETTEAALHDDDLRKERGEAVRQEFVDALGSWDQERARTDAAAIAGIDLSKVSRDGYKKVEVWSEKTFRERSAKEAFPLDPMMDAMAENDEIRFRPSRFLKPDGHVDADKVKKGATHEFLHAITNEEVPGAGGRQERLWDREGVPQDLNEGVTELFALRVAQKEGVRIENQQSYAGGDLVAARLLEGLVGKEALFADFLQGKTDGLRKAIDAKLGAHAADKILSRHMDLGDAGEGNAIILEIARAAGKAGIDVGKLWGDAKAEGFLDDVRVGPDGNSVTVSRDIEGKGVLSNTFFSDDAPLSPHAKPLRVYVSTLKGGPRFGADSPAAAAEGIRRNVALTEKAHAETESQFAAYPKSDFTSEQVRQQTLLETAANKAAEEIQAAKAKGENVVGTDVFFNARELVAPLQAAYDKASTPAEKAAVRLQIEQATEKAVQDVVRAAKAGVAKK